MLQLLVNGHTDREVLCVATRGQSSPDEEDRPFFISFSPSANREYVSQVVVVVVTFSVGKIRYWLRLVFAEAAAPRGN